MADAPRTRLIFEPGGAPDCGRREVIGLPGPLPDVGDDFDWRVRDYDGFRLFMMEELAARVPERDRFSPADLEVVLVEVLAAALDQLSDMADRVAAERTLETARRPTSVRRLLRLIGYDAATEAFARGLIDADPATSPEGAAARLERLWLEQPRLMAEARAEGPRALYRQRRMVTEADHGALLEEHPLVLRAAAISRWGGSWPVVEVAIIPWNAAPLDQGRLDPPPAPKAQAEAFHRRHGLPQPAWGADATTLRAVLSPYVEALRMAGQPVVIRDAAAVGVELDLSVRVAEGYFRSEVRTALRQTLGRGPGGLFAPGRLRFGEDLRVGDVLQIVCAIDGVEAASVDRLKRVGAWYPDEGASGGIRLDGIEVAVCDDDPRAPERGHLTLALDGGRIG